MGQDCRERGWHGQRRVGHVFLFNSIDDVELEVKRVAIETIGYGPTFCDLLKPNEEEEAMKIEMYDTDGRVLRRLGRYTVQEENGYLRKWACDVCLQLKAGTFYWDSTEEDPFRACARCLVDGDVIDVREDMEFGAAGAARSPSCCRRLASAIPPTPLAAVLRNERRVSSNSA